MNHEEHIMELLRSWAKETAYLSNITTIKNNKHGQAIISYGQCAVKILENLLINGNEPLLVMIALSEILQFSPVKEENRGIIHKMREDWIDYIIQSRHKRVDLNVPSDIIMSQERTNMHWDITNTENMESNMFLNMDDLETCYMSWTQDMLDLNTGPWLTSSLHSPSEVGMIESFCEYWA